MWAWSGRQRGAVQFAATAHISLTSAFVTTSRIGWPTYRPVLLVHPDDSSDPSTSNRISTVHDSPSPIGCQQVTIFGWKIVIFPIENLNRGLSLSHTYTPPPCCSFCHPCCCHLRQLRPDLRLAGRDPLLSLPVLIDHRVPELTPVHLHLALGADVADVQP